MKRERETERQRTQRYKERERQRTHRYEEKGRDREHIDMKRQGETEERER